jgi:bifunctional NMN adenylyltransferase/nudix hydrolase
VTDHAKETFIVRPTVDIAVLDGDVVLMGRKKDEKLWRLPGGFVDPDDKSLDEAAQRELKEETGLYCAPTYLASLKIEDDRFKGKFCIMTTLFTYEWPGGKEPVAGDDLVEVGWMPLSSILVSSTVPAHKPLIKTLLARRDRKTYTFTAPYGGTA